jgi:hypothetical protein
LGIHEHVSKGALHQGAAALQQHRACLPAQVLNTFYFLVGYLGFLSTWIMDTIFTFVRNPTLDWYNGVTSHTLRALSPHFVLARGLYDISQVALLCHLLCRAYLMDRACAASIRHPGHGIVVIVPSGCCMRCKQGVL